MSIDLNFEIGDGEFDTQKYKSSFARSVAVNSDFRLKKITSNLNFIKVQAAQRGSLKGAIPKMSDTQGQAFVRMRKVSVYFIVFIVTKRKFLSPQNRSLINYCF